MDLNFDYREFQRESMERLAKIYAESCNEATDQVRVDETFNKIQKILDCQQMEKCHPYLFTLDRANVNEEDKKKIDDLYECALKRGFISEKTEEDAPLQTECDCDPEDDCSSLCGSPEDALTNRPMTTPPAPEVETRPTFSVLYSAMKDGNVKLGEFYSVASDNESAKQDCISQLTAAGYNNISIMAIEQNTNAVNQNVEETPAGENLYGMYEDDSADFEKQETGNTDDNSENKDGGSTEDSSSGDAAPSFGNSDDSGSDSQENTQGSEEQKTDDEETADANGDGENKDDSSEEKEDTEKKDDSSSENTDSSEENKPEEDSEKKYDTEEKESDDKSTEDSEKKEEKKLTAAEKANLKEEYTKLFKQILPKVSTEKSVSEMTLQERTDFWTKLSEKWTKNDPSEFMTDKDQEKLNKIVAKPEEKEDK